MSIFKLIEIFPDQNSAKKAYQYALECGYKPQDITLLMKDNYEESVLLKKEKAKTLEDIGEGGVAGGTIGGILGMITAFGVNFIAPGIGVIIAGPLSGIVVGTLMGALLALGISETQTQEYEEAIKSGKVILCIDASPYSNLKKKWEEIKENK